MIDLIVEIFRTSVLGMVVLFLWLFPKHRPLKQVPGWHFFMWGFLLVFIGMVIDTTDNFPSLNRFVILGDTHYQSFVEKIFGYLLGNILIAIGTMIWIPGIIELHARRKEELDQANQEIRILTGLLPICARCKKIRDEQGRWKALEGYIQEHSDASFTHGICPECSDTLYPDLKMTPP